VQREVEDFRPGAAGFAPDEDFAVVAGGGEDVAVFGVRPGDTPDGAFVPGGVLVRRKGERGGDGNGEGDVPFEGFG
jgi:hypothetical protein